MQICSRIAIFFDATSRLIGIFFLSLPKMSRSMHETGKHIEISSNNNIHIHSTTMNIGDKIPEVLGIDQDGHEIKASDYRGRKIVLYSYPKANTSGCTAEACSLQAHKDELAAAGYEIIGVSKDKQAAQKKFAEAQGLQFPLIADTETALLQQLGCWGEKVACGRKTIGTLRTTYLVDEDGRIEKIFTPKEIKTKIHAEQILECIKAR